MYGNRGMGGQPQSRNLDMFNSMPQRTGGRRNRNFNNRNNPRFEQGGGYGGNQNWNRQNENRPYQGPKNNAGNQQQQNNQQEAKPNVPAAQNNQPKPQTPQNQAKPVQQSPQNQPKPQPVQPPSQVKPQQTQPQQNQPKPQAQPQNQPQPQQQNQPKPQAQQQPQQNQARPQQPQQNQARPLQQQNVSTPQQNQPKPSPQQNQPKPVQQTQQNQPKPLQQTQPNQPKPLQQNQPKPLQQTQQNQPKPLQQTQQNQPKPLQQPQQNQPKPLQIQPVSQQLQQNQPKPQNNLQQSSGNQINVRTTNVQQNQNSRPMQNNIPPKNLQNNQFQNNANHQNNQYGQDDHNNFNNSNTSLNRANDGQGRGRGGLGGGRRGDKMQGGNREEHFIFAKLKDISGSMADLPALDLAEQKFSGRNRLYIGNLTNDTTEQELQETFNSYGETSELFINKEKNFAFIRFDYKANAEKAKRDLDGKLRRGRPLRVRLAPHNAAIRVKNLTPFVTNELLFKAFEIFGKVERAIVKVDERGKSMSEGIVEFFRRVSAQSALRFCTDRCFFLTSSLRPVVVESFEETDEGDGYTEKSIPRRGPEYVRAREVGPRFAEASSFEHEYGTRWKQLYELYKQKEDALKRELVMEEEKLEAQMEYAKYEHETELLREQLRQRELDRERQKRSWENAERQADEMREKERENVLRQQEEMSVRMRIQEDELMRRQQENTLFMKAQQLNRLLDDQEQGMGNMGRGYDMQQDKRGNMQMDSAYGMDNFNSAGGDRMGYDFEDGMGRWDNRQGGDYPNKRRRF